VGDANGRAIDAQPHLDLGGMRAVTVLRDHERNPARRYADRHQLELAEALGSGKDGIVLPTKHKVVPASVAIKVLRFEESYRGVQWIGYDHSRMPRRSAPPKAVSPLRSATALQKVGVLLHCSAPRGFLSIRARSGCTSGSKNWP